MRTHDGRINHLQCRVGQAAAGERLQHHIPDATVSPAAELPKNRIPVAELLRQIAPRRAGPHQPKRRVHHTAMVARRTASATDQKRFEIRPLIIGQQSANQGCPPQRAALNQFSIPASIDLSTRPSLKNRQLHLGALSPAWHQDASGPRCFTSCFLGRLRTPNFPTTADRSVP